MPPQPRLFGFFPRDLIRLHKKKGSLFLNILQVEKMGVMYRGGRTRL